MPKRFWLLAAVALAASAATARGALVINEVLYDPEGPDSGSEWVELYNSGPWPAPLAGVAIEAGNGSRPGQWQEVWRGAEGQWVEPEGVFWIGGPYRDRQPDALADLGLQNGPDGARLLREGLEIDRVGWGELAYPEYYEGAPVRTVPSGSSLARREDGVDTDRNLDDFAAAVPSPGRRNRAVRDLSIRLRRGSRPLPVPWGEGELQARLSLENRGSETIDLSRCGVTVDGRSAGDWTSGSPVFLNPGDTLDFPVWLSTLGRSGAASWVALCALEGDEDPDSDRDTLRVWVGPPEVWITEVLPQPETGRSEWVELQVDSRSPMQPGWVMEDAGGGRLRTLEGNPFPRAAGIYVVAADATLDPAIPEESVLPWTGTWPSLNDRATGSAAADTLFLIDSNGLTEDWAVYGDTSRGSSWVRLPDAPGGSGLDGWALCAKPSPGTTDPENRSAASPNPGRAAPPGVTLERAPGGAWIRLGRDLFPAAYRIRVLDLLGQVVWTDSGESGDRVERWTRWDGRGSAGGACAAGVYVVEIETISTDGGRNRLRQPLVLGR